VTRFKNSQYFQKPLNLKFLGDSEMMAGLHTCRISTAFYVVPDPKN